MSFGRPSVNAPGSKLGNDAIASTSPVRGSSATPAAPSARPLSFVLVRSASSRARWVPGSIDVSTLLPGFGATDETTPRPTGWPAASTSTRTSPGVPRRKVS